MGHTKVGADPRIWLQSKTEDYFTEKRDGPQVELGKVSSLRSISSTYSSNSSPSFNTFDFILALYKIIEYLPCASHYASAEDTVTVPVLICALEPSGKDRF